MLDVELDVDVSVPLCVVVAEKVCVEEEVPLNDPLCERE